MREQRNPLVCVYLRLHVRVSVVVFVVLPLSRQVFLFYPLQ